MASSEARTTRAGKVVCFLEGVDVPASRYRVEQYEKALSTRGISLCKCYSKPGKFNQYPQKFAKSLLRYPLGACGMMGMIIVRIAQALRHVPGAEVVLLQRDLLYRIPWPFLEKAIIAWAKVWRKDTRIVLDIDDAIFLDARGEDNGRLSRKISSLGESSDQILAGNSYLAARFSPSRTKTIPTVLDTENYPVKRPESFAPPGVPLTLGWTGSRSTLEYLRLIEKPLIQFLGETQGKLAIVCEAGVEPPFIMPGTTMLPWHRESEIAHLHSFDVGIMPLPDDEWSKGKCGLKLLQYFAVGIPSVASPVGVNPEMVREGENGLLAYSESDWYRALKMLHEKRELLPLMGKKARAIVEERYSLEVWCNPWLEAVWGRRI